MCPCVRYTTSQLNTRQQGGDFASNDDDDDGYRRASTCCAKRWRKTTTAAATGVSATRGTMWRTRRRVSYLAQPAVHEQSSTSHVSVTLSPLHVCTQLVISSILISSFTRSTDVCRATRRLGDSHRDVLGRLLAVINC